MISEITQVTSLAYGGEGVGHLEDGRVVFVPGAFPGDECEIEYVDKDDRFVRAKLVSILSPSPERVPILCPEAESGRCGGCPWAGLSYDAQLYWKRRSVLDALERIGHVDAEHADQLVDDCIPSKQEWHYRNKVEFEVGQDVAGRFTLGMHAQGGSFSPISSCLLCPKRLQDAPRALTGAIRYAANKEDLGIERVGLRASMRTNDVEVAIWTKTGRFPRARIAQVVGDCLSVKGIGVVRVLLKGEAKHRKVAGVESLRGRGFWTENMNGRMYMVSAPSFFQVNTAGAENLVRLALEGLDIDGLDSVSDLYSGIGTFTLPLAQYAQSVVAVESSSSSIKDLRRNLERNGLYAEVIGGDVARELPSLGKLDKVVIDPPRSGLNEKVTQGLLKSAPRKIAYVSCNPTTLARDISFLTAGGYAIERITPVDLFPQTYHIETVTLLSRSDG